MKLQTSLISNNSFFYSIFRCSPDSFYTNQSRASPFPRLFSAAIIFLLQQGLKFNEKGFSVNGKKAIALILIFSFYSISVSSISPFQVLDCLSNVGKVASLAIPLYILFLNFLKGSQNFDLNKKKLLSKKIPRGKPTEKENSNLLNESTLAVHL